MKTTVTLSIDDSILNNLDKIADKNLRSRSNMVELLIVKENERLSEEVKTEKK